MAGIKKILFVCVGNTCRSQMAEGFAVFHGADRVEVRSAGTYAAGFVNATTIEVMREKGIDISRQTSDQLTDEALEWADIVVTLGCCSADEICPLAYKGEKYDWPIEDPLGRPLAETRRIRDDIEARVRELIKDE
ncbi:MAG: arsenate reductase ArsC [Thermodesulfobacteriota bacterium]